MDIRKEGAKFYDVQEIPIDDLDFYIQRLPTPDAAVLELGCGTGRVLIPLSQHCAFIQGVDLSEGMLEVCQKNLTEANIPPSKAQVQAGDISKLALDRKFDLITAPFRVFQNLTEDEQIKGYFGTIRKHLKPNGRAIVNTFKPRYTPEEILARNSRPEAEVDQEIPHLDGKMVRSVYYRKPAERDGERLVFYPNLVYQYWEAGEILGESEMVIAMRVHYPEQLEKLVLDHGFKITGKWGGYQNEAYGHGEELVIEFAYRDERDDD